MYVLLYEGKFIRSLPKACFYFQETGNCHIFWDSVSFNNKVRQQAFSKACVPLKQYTIGGIPLRQHTIACVLVRQSTRAGVPVKHYTKAGVQWMQRTVDGVPVRQYSKG